MQNYIKQCIKYWKYHTFLLLFILFGVSAYLIHFISFLIAYIAKQIKKISNFYYDKFNELLS